MENCKDSVEITMRATILDVTPDQTAAREAFVAEEAAEAAAEAAEAATEAPATETPATEAAPATAAAPEEEATAPAAAGDLDMELVAAGEKVFKKCAACHQVGEGAENKTGPHLNGVIGRTLGSMEGFNYSKTMAEMGASGTVWTEETMAEFLSKPRDYVKGTKMSFAGLKKEDELAAINEYLKSFSQ